MSGAAHEELVEEKSSLTTTSRGVIEIKGKGVCPLLTGQRALTTARWLVLRPACLSGSFHVRPSLPRRYGDLLAQQDQVHRPFPRGHVRGAFGHHRCQSASSHQAPLLTLPRPPLSHQDDMQTEVNRRRSSRLATSSAASQRSSVAFNPASSDAGTASKDTSATATSLLSSLKGSAAAGVPKKKKLTFMSVLPDDDDLEHAQPSVNGGLDDVVVV